MRFCFSAISQRKATHTHTKKLKTTIPKLKNHRRNLRNLLKHKEWQKIKIFISTTFPPLTNARKNEENLINYYIYIIFKLMCAFSCQFIVFALFVIFYLKVYPFRISVCTSIEINKIKVCKFNFLLFYSIYGIYEN